MEEEKKFIVRDIDHTKYYLWNAYEGYEDHFGNYIMYEKLNITPPLEVTAGLHKYMTKFYYQIKYNWKQFENKIDDVKGQIKKYETITNKEELEKEDYKFIMDFIEKFMILSGIKNIVFKEDDPGKSIEKNR